MKTQLWKTAEICTMLTKEKRRIWYIAQSTFWRPTDLLTVLPSYLLFSRHVVDWVSQGFNRILHVTEFRAHTSRVANISPLSITSLVLIHHIAENKNTVWNQKDTF